MTEIRLLIADPVRDALAQLALQHQTTIEQIASLILADGLLGGETKKVALQEEAHAASKASSTFKVSEHFQGYPFASIALAQGFVDAATKLPAVVAFKKNRGVSFRPRFATLDYLISIRGIPGIVVSFYGGPNDFQDPDGKLARGRKSYRTGRIHNADELAYFLPFLRQSFERRYGQIEEAAQ